MEIKIEQNTKKMSYKDISQIVNTKYSEKIIKFVLDGYEKESSSNINQSYTLFSTLVQSVWNEWMNVCLPDRARIFKQLAWEDDALLRVRKESTHLRLGSSSSESDESKRRAGEYAEILSELHVGKENAYLKQLSEKLLQLTWDHLYKEARKQIDIITDRKA